MAKKASTKPEAPSLEVTKAPSLPTTEPTAEDIAALVRQSHGGISRRMARLILIQRQAEPRTAN
jgi:hypothetical protein